MEKIVFTNDQMTMFRELSFDKNPLHCDDQYVKTTQYQRVVVFGMLATIVALGRYLNDRKAILMRVTCAFKKPLFVGPEYDLQITEKKNGAVLSITKRGVVQQSVTVQLEFRDSLDVRSNKSKETNVAFQPLAQPSEKPIVNFKNLGQSYQINLARLAGMGSKFGLSIEQVPLSQLQPFFWASYLVGMEVPGKQALFSRADFQFAEATAESNVMAIEYAPIQVDSRFNLHSINGSSTGVTQFSIEAFQRPDPVKFDWSRLNHDKNLQSPLSAKNIFITGAARGFGLASAAQFAAARAKVFANFRNSDQDIEAIRSAIPELRTHLVPIQGDLLDDKDQRSIASQLQEMGGVDVLFLNASPPILPSKFEELSVDEFFQFLRESITLHFKSLQSILPVMKDRGLVAHVSTVYLDEPPRHFSHYLAAKSAMSGLLKGIAADYPQLTIIDLKLPKMLTDQTNVPIQNEAIASAQDAASSVVAEISKCIEGAKGYNSIRLTNFSNNCSESN